MNKIIDFFATMGIEIITSTVSMLLREFSSMLQKIPPDEIKNDQSQSKVYVRLDDDCPDMETFLSTLIEALNRVADELENSKTLDEIIDVLEVFCEQFEARLGRRENEVRGTIQSFGQLKTHIDQVSAEIKVLSNELHESSQRNENILHQTEENFRKKLRLTKFWETARQEQKNAECHLLSESMSTELKTCDETFQMETNFNEEANKFLLQKQNKLKKRIAGWKNAEEEEKTKLTASMKVLKAEFSKMTEDIEIKQREFQKRQSVVDDYSAKKRKIDERQRKLDMAKQKAVLIQAWWRGVMCRKKLKQLKRDGKKSLKKKKKKKVLKK